MKKVNMYIYSLVIIILILVVYLFSNVYNNYKRIEEMGIGKDLYIKIEQNETIDYLQIDKEKKSGTVKRLWFDMWNEQQRKKLIQYMKDNNLKIKPGVYKINQTSYFKDVVRILKFNKISKN